MRKYAIPSSAYKNQLFSKAIHNKYNSLRAKKFGRESYFSLPKSNFVAG
jgi:hypothetical protein